MIVVPYDEVDAFPYAGPKEMKNRKRRFTPQKAALLFALLGCIIGAMVMFSFFGIAVKTGRVDQGLPTLGSVPAEPWAALSRKRIFLGHQSVGYNIIDGIKAVTQDHEYIRLNIVETSDLTQGEQPLFAHGRIGENRKPLSKIEAFEKAVGQDRDVGIDIALMKLCYIDIQHDSEVDSVFQAYRQAIERLKNRHAKMAIVHCTVPLRSIYTGPRWRVEQGINRVLGRPTLLDDNYQRHSYNQLLRQMYRGADSIYDLALVESTTPQGRSYYAKKSQAEVPFLCLDYSADGGHLNALGKRKAAEQLLITLAEVAYKQDQRR